MDLVSTFSNSDISGKILYRDLKYKIEGKFTRPGVRKIEYRAAAPADLRLSYSGSGLPFATPEQAYDHSPNIGSVETSPEGSFEIELYSPNSYYVCEGIELIRPHVHLTILGDTPQRLDLKLGPGIPNRSLRHLEGRPDRSYGR